MSDPLASYREKRNFDATPEPPGVVAAPSPGVHPSFMVHKHDARRLHYDLRLEIDGVLASWAIPQGPSPDPTQKRLAVQTEDHPLAYGQFEGRIPEGQYGAGDALIWDRGVYDTLPPGNGAAMHRKGHLDLILLGEKLQGRWHLVRTGKHGEGPDGPGAQWLFFKAEDAHAAPGLDLVGTRPESVHSGRRITRGPLLAGVKARQIPPINLLIALWPPCQPEPWTDAAAPSPEEFVLHACPAGTRALAALSAKRVALQTDESKDLAAAHPAIAQRLGKLEAHELVLDGVVTAKARFVATDLLWLDDRDLRLLPLEDRLELLASLLPASDPLIGPLATAPLDPADHETLTARRRGSTVGQAGAWLLVTPRPASRALP